MAIAVRKFSGTGSPEGVITAPPLSRYHQSDAASGSEVWVKASGTGNTGWRLEGTGPGGGSPPDASTTVKGVAKASVAPASATDPIFTGTNDPRVPTQGENDALQGTNGTPSTSNRYLTDSDPRVPTQAENDALAGTSGTISGTNRYVTNDDPRVPTQGENDALQGTIGTPSNTNRFVTDTDGRVPTAGENDALQGTNGTPSNTNRYVTNTDPRNTDARTPTSHNHNASEINAGTMATARLGSGTADANKVLFGDSRWDTPPAGGGGGGGATGPAVLAGYTLTNHTPDKAIDPTATSVSEVAQFAATIASELSGPAGTFNPLIAVNEWDDFVTGNSPSGQVGKLGWGHLNGNAPSLLVGTAGRPGLCQKGTGATANTVACLFLRLPIGNGPFDAADSWDTTWSLKLDQNDTDTAMRVGLCDAQPDTNPPADGIYIEKLFADTGWFPVTRNAGTQTRAGTQIAAVGTSYFKLRVRRVNGTTVGFTFDGGTEVTHTTNVPPGDLMPFIQIVNQTAVDKTFTLDLFHLVITGLSR